MFGVVTAIGAFLAVSKYTSLLEAVGYFLCVAALWRLYLWPTSNSLRVARLLGALATCAVFWLLSVDRSDLYEVCPDCDQSRDITQIRVFHFPISERIRVNLPFKARVAGCLGVSCPHGHFERTQLRRYWGLIYCGYPCWNGTLTLDERWTPKYEAALCQVVEKMRQADSELPREFDLHVLQRHDADYWKELADQIRNDPILSEYSQPATSREVNR
jgi:hypothetical protein